MIGISKLYCGAIEASDALRYKRRTETLPNGLLRFARDKKPVVVWNCTKTCNLRCRHCYAESDGCAHDQLSTTEAKALIDDLAAFGSPALLLSGGEPCMRDDLVEIAAYARKAGLRVTLSTNGTLIDAELACELARVDLSYVGISLDGGPETHDRFRGMPGAFERAMRGVANAKEAGMKVGLRFTIHQQNYREVDTVFDIMRDYNVDRVCFYHLVYTGRGSDMMNLDLTHDQTRAVMRLIMDRTRAWFDEGGTPEVLTVDNHADAPFLYLELLREDPARAAKVLKLLQYNQGSSTGNGIACVSWDGEVHADQFWRHFSFGNVRERPFSQIWTDTSRTTKASELMFRLKDKRPFVKGRCASCRWLDICGGNFRVRAEAATGDLWAPDPACYLTDEEIAPHADDPAPMLERPHYE